MGPKPTQKRPAPSSSSQPSQNSNSNPKRRKVLDNRNLTTQTSASAFNGEIDIAKFVKAREFEIRALEDGIVKSGKVLSSRAFQEVPRELRRRQASHNAKRVPKRLRGRAEKEMREDNTPTVDSRTRSKRKNGKMRLRLDTARELRDVGRRKKKEKNEADVEVMVTRAEELETEKVEKSGTVVTRKGKEKKARLVKPPAPPAKFRKRQIDKTWLPTHMFHTKRAKMTEPKEPLWRFAIPLTPAVKSYRPIHRASQLRGAVVWDMSYMATIGLKGACKSLEALLRALGIGSTDDIWSSREGQKWRRGVRAWNGWIFERDEHPHKPIAPATILWRKGSVQKPDEDTPALSPSERKSELFLRVHPSAFLKVWEQVLRLSKVQKPGVRVEDLRYEIGSIEITGPAASETLASVLWPVKLGTTDSLDEELIENIWPKLGGIKHCAELPKNILIHFEATDPRLHHPPRQYSPSQSFASEAERLNTTALWPPDKTLSEAAIFERSKRLAASRQLPSQKAIGRRKSTTKGSSYPEPLPTDPKIPVLLCTKQTANSSSKGTWTVLMPWKCISPVWNSLMYYPVSETGGNPRFGGLHEQQQIAFESGQPWFPGDFPGTAAGEAWELQESLKRKTAWDRMPKGKRVEWDTLDLGLGRKGEVGQGWACDWQLLLQQTQTSDDEPITSYHLNTFVAQTYLAKKEPPNNLSGALSTIHLKFLGRGTATVCARIYRLPTTNPDLCKTWLAQLCPSKKPPTQHHLPKDAPIHDHRARLAAQILSPTLSNSSEDHPPVPDAEDLIGFVTSGNYNLSEGGSTAIGSVLVSKLSGASVKGGLDEGRLCVVRNAGERVGRLARWELTG